jgi:hypothetical protein
MVIEVVHWEKCAPGMDIHSSTTDFSKSVCWTISDLSAPFDHNFAVTLVFQQMKKFSEGMLLCCLDLYQGINIVRMFCVTDIWCE